MPCCRFLFSNLIALSLCIVSTVYPQERFETKNRIPPGQRAVDDFHILHIASVPDLSQDNWSLTVRGEVRQKIKFDWTAFKALDPVKSVSDFHCVTGWTRLNNHWEGVRIRDIIALADPTSPANFVTFRSYDGYTTSLAISECTGDDDILAFQWEGKPIDKDLGGPVRVIIPGKYGYKGALWIKELVLTKKQEEGFWEKRGYSNSADPWKEERFEK